jgi:uncharacterized protein Usg
MEMPTITVTLALHLLQEYDIGVEFTQALTQFVQHNALVEMGQTLVNVVGHDVQCGHKCLINTASANHILLQYTQ